MPFKFNPIYGTLDLVNATSTSTGNVTGVPPTDINAIARWDDTTGTTIKNSPGTLVQDSGAINAQAFVYNREILNDVTIPDNYAMIVGDLDLVSGDIILEGDAELISI